MDFPHVHRLRADDLMWRELGDRIVVLDLRTSTSLAVAASGTIAWKMLQAGATTDELVAQVCAEYDIDDATARNDLELFLADLQSRGVLA